MNVYMLFIMMAKGHVLSPPVMPDAGNVTQMKWMLKKSCRSETTGLSAHHGDGSGGQAPVPGLPTGRDQLSNWQTYSGEK